MPKDTVLDAYERGDSESQQVRAQLSEFKGRQYFSIRAWYLDGEEYKPARNGINLPVDEYKQFRELVDALDEAIINAAVDKET